MGLVVSLHVVRTEHTEGIPVDAPGFVEEANADVSWEADLVVVLEVFTGNLGNKTGSSDGRRIPQQHSDIFTT